MREKRVECALIIWANVPLLIIQDLLEARKVVESEVEARIDEVWALD